MIGLDNANCDTQVYFTRTPSQSSYDNIIPPIPTSHLAFYLFFHPLLFCRRQKSRSMVMNDLIGDGVGGFLDLLSICLSVCVCVYVHVCVRACVCVFVCAHVRACHVRDTMHCIHTARILHVTLATLYSHTTGKNLALISTYVMITVMRRTGQKIINL